MTDVELLPLPEGYDKYSPPRLYDGQMFHEGQMRAYARANVLHHTAALQAEIETLRAERESLWAEVENWKESFCQAASRAERLEKANPGKRRRYNPSGSLSEYGIFPECDATPAAQAPRACTCHPDDRPDGPCRERYAASECQALASVDKAMVERSND